MTSVTITETSTTNNVTYYHINLKIPLRSITTVKRYSEFLNLVNDLSQDLGINVSDFPYRLPSKTSIFNKNSASTIEVRKLQLVQFLRHIITDPELQNHPIVHTFLQLPSKFEFTTSKTFNIDGNVDASRWLEALRLLRSQLVGILQDFERGQLGKLEFKSKVHTIITPNLTKLSVSLDSLKEKRKLSDEEFTRRSQLLQEIKHDVDKVITNFDPQPQKPSRRILGKEAAQETKATLPLSNKELLQHQLQIHKQQDSELLEIAKIIERQKQIGLTINQEIEEQNELLDSLNDQVDVTTNKLKNARKNAKRIL